MKATCRILVLTLAVWHFASCTGTVQRKRRYLLYDCNPLEGFNLRRDVYTRMATLVNYLNTRGIWVLVLPPWGRMSYHWNEQGMEQSRIRWSEFFDVESLRRHANVMEYEDYVSERGKPEIDEVWYLQRYAEGYNFENWENKAHERACIETPVYDADSQGRYRGFFWGYPETYAMKFKCISAQGGVDVIAPALLENTTATAVMLDRGETLSHMFSGGKHFWDARRSMVFSSSLINEANYFRHIFLNSDDVRDKTVQPERWEDNARKDNSALGGPYIAAHLRRKDYLVSRPEKVPSLEKAAERLKQLAQEYGVEKIFVASDGTEEDMMLLERLLPNMIRYNPLAAEKKHFNKGAIAIIDQIICSHARYFIGSYESTFTFRITEEREIMGFSKETTYNRFCGDEEDPCQQLTKYKIVWKDDSELWSTGREDL